MTIAANPTITIIDTDHSPRTMRNTTTPQQIQISNTTETNTSRTTSGTWVNTNSTGDVVGVVT